MIKVASLFNQILSTIRTAVDFDNLVAKHEAEKNSKGFESKAQLVSMLFGHLAKAARDYEQFRSWNDGGVFFVTRMKVNASYDVGKVPRTAA